MKGKTIFITGGNDGIGLATAKLFSQQGTNVAIVGRREEQNAKAAREIRAAGVDCVYFTGDVTDEAFMKNAVEKTCEEYGVLHYAFNSAGVDHPAIELARQTVDDFRRILDINVTGTWLSMKAQIPAIIKSGGGCVVNNSSIVGLVGMPSLTAYTASKHAVNGLTKSVALEFASQGVRVNAICPGPTLTSLSPKDPEQRKKSDAMLPMRCRNKPEEVALAVLFFCRDAPLITGQCMAIDGGFTAQ